MSQGENNTCFVIMPISDCEGYEQGHFLRVYEDVIKPAVEKSGYIPQRADETKNSNLIQLDILKKLIDAPIAICDLSTRNPNVLFELGIRQAFDKPVVLIQEKGTPAIFDISPLRYIEYDKRLGYREVLKSQSELSEAIIATKEAEGDSNNINSIVRLLSISPASMPQIKSGKAKESLEISVLSSQISDLRNSINFLVQGSGRLGNRSISLMEREYERLSNKLDRLESTRNKPIDVMRQECIHILQNVEELMMRCDGPEEHRMISLLMDRGRSLMNRFDKYM